MRKTLTCLLAVLLLTCFRLAAQQALSRAPQLALIDSIREFIKNDLKLDAGKDFYTAWEKDNEGMYVYLYVSQSDSVIIPDNLYKNYWRFENEESAQAESKKLKALGFETLIYKTAGTTEARLSQKLLSYPDEAIAFIIFHEAVHRRPKEIMPAVPYIFEEALCDAVANAACIRFAEKTKLLDLKKVKKQKDIFESIYSYFNEARANIEKSPPSQHADIMKACTAELLKLTKHGNQFVFDRMLYPVNHAYFLRLEAYSLNYFLMRNMLGPDIDISRATKRIQRLTTVKPLPLFKEADDESPAEINLPKQPSMFDSGH